MKLIKLLMFEEVCVWCKGFLFDFDGMLVDFLFVVEWVWSNWVRCYGLVLEEVLVFIYGKQVIIFLCYFMVGKFEVDIVVEFMCLEYIEVMEIEGIIVFLGVIVLFSYLNKVGILWVIVIFGFMLVV